VLHPDFARIVESAHEAGIGALAVETDLLGISANAIDRLADLPLDIVSVNLPAVTAQTYQKVMGIDAYLMVMENLTRLVQRRQANKRGVPVIVPTFVKTAANLQEMEVWNDHWIRTLGSAVIVGPTDFAGQVPDVSLVQMEPPRRRACSRISRRMMILSDGQMTACEQDFRGAHALGRLGTDSIESIWNNQMSTLRRQHADGEWQAHPLCAGCKDWHRP
jgi:radical SAM protein with 4Fe4S-binding SPASM domain